MRNPQKFKEGGLFDLVAGIDIGFPAGENGFPHSQKQVNIKRGRVIDLLGGPYLLFFLRSIIGKIGFGLDDGHTRTLFIAMTESNPQSVCPQKSRNS